MSGEDQHLADIAIVGMAGRFPKSPDVASFWQNLREGVECISFFSEEELLASGVDPALAKDPAYVPAQGWLDGIDLFDAPFFEMSPREAEVTDPQFRFFLECAWQALEDAGYDPARHPGAIGVIAGVSNNAYVIDNLITNPGVIESMGYVQTALGNHTDFLSTRVAYKFDLRGPAVTIQTACSTSLVAVHMACQSLLSGESDAVLAGGVCITALEKRGYLFVEGGTNTSDGHVRTFDARGDGMLGGNGVGVVMLKRLEDALEAGDTIRAVIKGTAINNDGAHKVSFTAPSIDGQSQVVMDALDVSGVDPETITMVEAHGTATPLGDPIEVRALNQAWRRHTQATGYCAIGSAKTNLGHLDIAAGVTGLIKTTLSLQHKEIPPSLHFETANPEIDFASSPFFVNTELREWKTEHLPRRAALSSFGMGGTNAHAILEEAPEPRPTSGGRDWQVLTFAARSQAALDAMPGRLADHLEATPELDLADAAYTLHLGRAEMPLRRAVIARDGRDAVAALRALGPKHATPSLNAQTRRPVAWLFSGQGAQYADMARGLHESESAFREAFDRCAELFAPHLEENRDLRMLVFPPAGGEDEASATLALTQFTQPALFAVEYALAQLWRSYGLEPESMLGHSIGEFVAATLAGVFSLEDACRLVAARGRLIGSLPPGGTMLAVQADEDDVQAKLSGTLSIATVNAPGLVVVSGPETEVAALEERLDSAGIGTRRLHTSHAFHSALMDPILDAFRAEVETVTLNAPQIPIVSCTTGSWLRDEEATDPAYWVRHLRQPVRFADGVATLVKDPGRALLEVGPGETLASLARLGAPGRTVIVASTRHPKDDRADLAVWMRAVGELWTSGVQLDWEAFHAGETRRRVPLPTYPFERQSYWIEAADGPAAGQAPAPVQKKASDLTDWFYVPAWKQAAPPLCFPREESAERPWLVFADESGLAAAVTARIEALGSRVVRVRAGSAFAAEAGGYVLAPGEKDQYQDLFRALEADRALPGAVVHLWGVDDPGSLEEATERGFHSLLFLGQELAERDRDRPLPIGVVTAGLQDVLGSGEADPRRALVLGPAKCMDTELSGVTCQAIDLDAVGQGALKAAAGAVIDEVRGDTVDRVVALAGGQRWVQSYSPARVPEPAGTPRLREGGTYLITGGVGGIGLTFAEHLARSGRPNLILLGRSELPEADTWDEWLAKHDADDPVSTKIRGIRHLEELGATVMTGAAAADDADGMRAVVQEARARFGDIHGVIHAAGIVGAGLLAMKTRENAERVLAPKLAGTEILRDLFPDGSLDFLVFVSSIATATGVLSGVDYTSANAYLDVLARATHGRRTFTAAYNWDAWRDVGIATRAEVPAAMRAAFEESMRCAIAPDEGREAFARLLATDLPHVYVSPLDLVQRDDFATAEAAAPAEDGAAVTSASATIEKPTQPRPELATELVEPQTETQTAIAAVWSELLGVAPVGIHDSFFELGGNSLVMMQLNVRLRALFGVSLPIRELFDAPQISILAERIDSIRAVSAAPIDQSSEEEIEEFTL